MRNPKNNNGGQTKDRQDLGAMATRVRLAVRKVADEGKDVEETVARIAREATASALAQTHLGADKVREVSHTVLSAAVETGEEVGTNIAEVARGAIQGTSEGITSALQSTQEALSSTGARTTAFVQTDLAQTKKDLETIENAFLETIRNVASRSQDVANDVLCDFSDKAMATSSALKNQLHQTIEKASKRIDEDSGAGTSPVGSLIERINHLQAEIGEALSERAKKYDYSIEGKRIAFAAKARTHQRQFKRALWKHVLGAKFLSAVTAPIIYSLIVPLLILDVFLSFYQAICFRAYRIERARRSDFIVFDRQHLAYLNVLEKLNCMYCSYANGLLAYAVEIAARSEAYWCPIKHANRLRSYHQWYSGFSDYGDAENYRSDRERSIEAIRPQDASSGP